MADHRGIDIGSAAIHSPASARRVASFSAALRDDQPFPLDGPWERADHVTTGAESGTTHG